MFVMVEMNIFLQSFFSECSLQMYEYTNQAEMIWEKIVIVIITFFKGF